MIKQLAESTLIDKIFDNMELNLQNQWKMSDSHEKVRREELYLQTKLLTAFKAEIRHFLNEYSEETEGD